MGDWLTELAFGSNKAGGADKGTLKPTDAFMPGNHGYTVHYADTEHLVYAWASTDEENVRIQAIYTQLFSSSRYYGKEISRDLTSGASAGTLLNRLLMNENPIGNTLTIRLTKEENGVTYYAEGEIFDPSGMTVTAVYANGLTRDVTQYIVYGAESSESVAQVLTALTEFGPNPEDARFVKNGTTLESCLLSFRDEDGSFRHVLDGEPDPMATEQAFYALVALKRAALGESTLYTMTERFLARKNI